MAASSRSLLGALLLLATPLAAQTPAEVTGRVVRLTGADTVAVAGAGVVLHRVGQDTQGPLDSLPADGAGRFRFRFTTDTGAVYLLSVRHHGITYFSSPVARDPATRVDDILLIVSDTSAVAPVAVAARSLIVGAAEASGARTVVEVVELANRGQQTRVSPESVPTFAMALARGGHGFVVEDTDLSPEAVRIEGDSLRVYAPLAPGERVVILQYTIPAGTRRLELPAGHAVDTMQVLLEEGQLALESALPRAGSETIEGRPYGRWVGPWPADSTLAVAVTGLAVRPSRVLTLLVAGLALAMGLVLLLVRRRRAPPATGPAPPAPRDPAVIVDAIARLDAAHQGRVGELPPEAWAAYQRERARLKGELERTLAGSPPAP